MSEEMNQYTRSSLVMAINILFLYLGVVAVEVEKETGSFTADYTLVFSSFLLLLIVSIGLSFLNRTPIGGVFIGVSLSGSYWVGFLTSLLIKFNTYQSNLEPVFKHWQFIFSVIGAFTSLGLFFGLLGYLSDRLLVENPIIETYAYRDYWSNVHKLGKNARREYDNLDRRLTRAHITVGDWWRQRIHRMKHAKPELLFINNSSKSSTEKIGDVYDITTGKILYQNVVDPNNLLGIYKPSIFNIPKTSASVGGGRRLASEELVSRFLGWFVESRAVWVLYAATSLIFIASLFLYFNNIVYANEGEYKYILDAKTLLIGGITLSAITLYFVYRFRSLSRALYDKRPDERMMVFVMYLIFFMFYILFYQVITSMDLAILQQKTLFDTNTVPWVTTIKWFLLFTSLIALTYIFIHRECEISNVYLYDNAAESGKIDSQLPYRDKRDKPYWLDNDGTEQYWVLRFMYYWSYELTLPPHPDWERMEVWVDSKTGEAKWIVSDYHYRELWYKVESDIRGKGIQIGFLANFHTPVPFVTDEELARYEEILKQSKMALLKMLISGRLYLGELNNKKYVGIHPPHWVERYGLTGLAASFCSSLNWCYWRYPWGIDNQVKYAEYPSSLVEEQPQAH